MSQNFHSERTGLSRDPHDLAFRDNLIKVDRDTSLEQFLQGAGIITGGLGIIMVWTGIYGCSSRRRITAPNPAFLPYGYFTLFLSGAFFLLRYFTDNHYLVDPEYHCVYYHFKFLWHRRIRLLLASENITAVTTGSKKCSSKTSSWWEYRVVLVSAQGKIEPLTNWKREKLDECNILASDLASKLQTQYISAPACCILCVSMVDGAPDIVFDESSFFSKERLNRLIIIAIVIALFMVFNFWYLRQR